MNSPQVVVRRLSPTDADLVIANGHAFAQTPSVEWTEDFLARDGNVLLLALEGGTAVGSLVAVETANLDTAPDLFVYEVYVQPERRGRGVAGALIRKIVDLGTEAGCSRVWATLARTSPNAGASPIPEASRSDTTSIVIPLD